MAHCRLPSPWKELAAHNGGVMRLCEKLDINYSTLWRWAHDGMWPDDAHRQKLDIMFEAIGEARIYDLV